MIRGWADLLRSLGESLAAVFGAEAAALKGDLRASGRRLFVAVMIGAAAAFLFFWSVGVGAFLLFQVLVLWLPQWGAAAIVLGVFLVAAGICTALARRRLGSIELPAETVRRRIDDHVAWWQQEVLHEPTADQGQLEGDGRASRQETANTP